MNQRNDLHITLPEHNTLVKVEMLERNQRKETQMNNRGEMKDYVKRDKGFRSFI